MLKPETKFKVNEVTKPLLAKGNFLEAARQIALLVGEEKLDWRMAYDVINDAKEDMLEIFTKAGDSAEAFQALEAAYFLDVGEIGSPANQRIMKELAGLSRGLINTAAHPLLDELQLGYKAYLAGDKFSYKRSGKLYFFSTEKALYEAVAKDYGITLTVKERE